MTSSPAPDGEREIFRVPPAPPRGTRIPSLRSASQARARLVADGDRHEMRVESGLEYKAAQILLARRDVVDVQEQPAAVSYVDDAGQRHQHTFDFRATMRDGRRVFVEVKPEDIAERIGLNGLLRTIASQVPQGVADRVVHLGERVLTRDAVHDARLIRVVRRDRHRPAETAVAAIVDGMAGRMTVAEIVRVSGLGAQAFRSVVRAVDDGRLRVVCGRRIGYGASVVRAGSLADGGRS